jgi:hypothetical protein
VLVINRHRGVVLSRPPRVVRQVLSDRAGSTLRLPDTPERVALLDVLAGTHAVGIISPRQSSMDGRSRSCLRFGVALSIA